jgi:hypothetical protein
MSVGGGDAPRAPSFAGVLPRATVEAAAALGLVLETAPAMPALDACVSDWCTDGRERSDCGRACPPEMRASLWETLGLLVEHRFVTSSAHRYVPSFRPETLFVESFPETAPDAATPLLEALALPRRRGLSRTRIEEALLTRGGAVCERLGLDPFEFVVACVPYDVYFRLATTRGWGRERVWTHFDGYQVTPDHHLRALVGGDVRYGGPDDLCSVGRGYDSDHLTARFAVLRRDRLVPDQAPAPSRISDTGVRPSSSLGTGRP